MTDYTKQIAFIETCDIPRKLRQLLAQAKSSGTTVLEEAAFARLVELEPQELPGSLEYDFLRCTEAFERVIGTRLSPIRQKVAREGTEQVLLDIIQADGMNEDTRARLDQGLPELTTEALVLRHPDRFGPTTRDTARARLTEAGVNPKDLP